MADDKKRPLTPQEIAEQAAKPKNEVHFENHEFHVSYTKDGQNLEFYTNDSQHPDDRRADQIALHKERDGRYSVAVPQFDAQRDESADIAEKRQQAAKAGAQFVEYQGTNSVFMYSISKKAGDAIVAAVVRSGTDKHKHNDDNRASLEEVVKSLAKSNITLDDVRHAEDVANNTALPPMPKEKKGQDKQDVPGR